MSKPKKSAPASSKKKRREVPAHPQSLGNSSFHLCPHLRRLSRILSRHAHLRPSAIWSFPTRPPNVVLKNRPAWMSDFLAEEIIKNARPIGLHSAFDHQLLIDTYNLLKSNPWIKQVNQVRRVYDQRPADTIEIDCDYRAPVALVKWRRLLLARRRRRASSSPSNTTAAQLPRIMFGSDGKVNVRIIDGVTHPPVESGANWPGSDLAGGLELIKLLAGKPYAEEIRRVNVSNFDGRTDPQAAQNRPHHPVQHPDPLGPRPQRQGLFHRSPP